MEILCNIWLNVTEENPENDNLQLEHNRTTVIDCNETRLGT